MKIDWEQLYDPEDLQRIKAPIAIVLIILIVLIVKVSGIGTRHYETYEVVRTTPASDSADIAYIHYEKDVIKFSKDGIALINKKEESVWTETFDLDNPAAETCEEYIAVADIQGNDVYIFNRKGKVSNSTMPYPIQSVQVAKQGVFAVSLEDKDDNYIQLYNREGELLAEIKTSIRENGYPLSMALSEDGKNIVISSMVIEGMSTNNIVMAYNFGSAGKKVKNNCVWSKEFDDMVIPEIRFMDKKTLCLFGDNATYIYNMGQKPGEKPIAVIEFDTEINSIFTGDSHLGYVCKNAESTDSGLLKIYNTNGGKLLEKEINFDYNKIRFDEDEIVAVGDYNCTILSMKGKQIFHTTFEHSLIDVIPTRKNRQYMIIGDKYTDVIKLK